MKTLKERFLTAPLTQPEYEAFEKAFDNLQNPKVNAGGWVIMAITEVENQIGRYDAFISAGVVLKSLLKNCHGKVTGLRRLVHEMEKTKKYLLSFSKKYASANKSQS